MSSYAKSRFQLSIFLKANPQTFLPFTTIILTPVRQQYTIYIVLLKNPEFVKGD